MAILGIDIGGTKTAVLVGTAAGEILARREFPTEPRRGFDAFLQDILRYSDELGTPAPSCASIAVGGPMRERDGILLGPPHLPGWTNVPLRERIGAALGLPCHWMHDARASALAENLFGTASSARHAHITFATGFGLGVVLDGRLLDIPGEIGHWRVAETGPELFGKQGSLEGLASGAGIALQAAATGRFPSTITASELADRARGGDAPARRIFDDVAVQVGRQCARLIDLFGLRTITLGTIAIHAGDLLLDPIREIARAESLAHLGAECVIAPATLGSRLGDVASLAAAIHAGVRDDARLGPSARVQLRMLVELGESVHADRALLASIDEAARRVVACLAAGNKVLTCGNGGSATDAAHLAEELIGRYRGNRVSLPAVNLAADGSVLTCIANDFGFDEVFTRQVDGLARAGDVLVAFTTSGNSENINRAIKRARERGAFAIALTGKGGGPAKELADLAIHIPHHASERIQELHAFVMHAICEAAESAFK